MSSMRAIAVVAVVAVVIVLAIVLWMSRDPAPGDTVNVTRGSINVTIETIGRVAVRDSALVRAEVGGLVKLVAVTAGQQVDRGDVIARLERGPFDVAIRRAEEQLASAESVLALVEQQGSTRDPETFVERINAQQRVREAEQALATARANLARSLILAPQAGTVLVVSATEGAAVTENAEIAQIAGLREFELVLEIDEIDFPYVQIGADTRIILEAYPNQPIVGRIDSIARQAQLVGGTTVFPAAVVFDAPDGITVLPGMNAEVELTTDVREGVLLLPERALQTVGRRTFVDVVRDGRVERVEIRTGLRSEGMVEVAAGLSEDDEVVLP
jgi:multidrug efflux pump subunit AcrA (membrane-fusion protein)